MNNKIEITEHICKRYIQRFNQNLASITNVKERLKAAEQAVKAIIMDAHYISDDKRGILLYSKTYDCCLIVRNKMLITLYKPDVKSKLREQKFKNKYD